MCSSMTTETKASLACIPVAIDAAEPDPVFILPFLLLSYAQVDTLNLHLFILTFQLPIDPFLKNVI